MPKSVTLILPVGVTSRLAGLTSRCTNPRLVRGVQRGGGLDDHRDSSVDVEGTLWVR